MLEREAMAILVSAGVPYSLRGRALALAGSALAVLSEPEKYANALTQDGVIALRKAVNNKNHILDELFENKVHLVIAGEEGYPQRLLQIPQPPHLLFVQGERNIDAPLPLAIVGTRSASEYGLMHTRTISRMLACQGVCIVSGLAVGIDAAAHEGALQANGRTVAVLGGALNRFYPAENRWLRDRIIENGGSVVTEYQMGVSPKPYAFLKRNRIIAGMTMGTLVADGPVKSGALRTATDAADYGREVFALPGDVDAPGSALPHKLIAEGAHLVTCAADVLSVLAPQLALEIDGERQRPYPARASGKAEKKQAKQQDVHKEQAGSADDLPPQERAVLAALEGGEMEFDALCEQTGMDGATLGTVLMELEMDGLITSLPGLRYARLG